MRFPLALAFALLGATGVAGPGYSLRSTTLDSGTEIRQYVTAEGQVFAVSWTGPSLPDLRTILGPHFQTLVDHERSRRPGARAPLQVQHDGVVIFSSGHMGAFAGRAWVPALLPPHFDPADIR